MCIIVSKEINHKFILAKNRDRAYKPILEVIHTIIDGVEIAYLYDSTTDWSEGMNEYGIGIVNSALLVRRDEVEHKMARKLRNRGLDGVKMRNIMKQKTIDDAIDSVLTFKGNSKLALKGHTFIASPNKMVSVETTSRHKPDMQIHNIKETIVRTNHGHKFTDAGYTSGIKCLSSKTRKLHAEMGFENIKDWTHAAGVMREQHFEKNSELNMRRDTKNMFTSSQTVMNLTDLIFQVVWFSDKVKSFNGINNQLPKDYKPKIQILIDKIDV